MNEKSIPRLSGGTFFTLLLEAAKQELYERKKWGESREFTESDVFESLFQVAVPTYEKPEDMDNFKPVVSAYKSCNQARSGRLPINEQANKTSFNHRFKNEYQVPLSSMTVLIENYINIKGKGEWLVRALLELIEKDESINATEDLYVCGDGSSITKDHIKTLTTINVPAFLLGIWHYVVQFRTDNSVGKDTYDVWCKPGKSKNTREPFKSDIGEGIARTIKITMTKTPETENNADAKEDIKEEPFIEFDESYVEEPDLKPYTTSQIINSSAVFFSSGENAIQINNTGTINIDRSGKK